MSKKQHEAPKRLQHVQGSEWLTETTQVFTNAPIVPTRVLTDSHQSMANLQAAQSHPDPLTMPLSLCSGLSEHFIKVSTEANEANH